MIEVSRSDIVSDYLMEIPPETRFIKLPIEGYLDLLNVTRVGMERPQKLRGS